MSLSVTWSRSLETMADKLYDSWKQELSAAANPLGKICIVVDAPGTRDWLKSRYLLDGQSRPVLLSVDFIPLPQFINDWLAAQTHDAPLRQRHPARHPYSTAVLTWRIYDLLKREADNSEFAELKAYIGQEQKHQARRRHALAEQLAQLFDGYLNSRFEMLRGWEKGIEESMADVPRWQVALYRMLTNENPDTYAADYEAALDESADLTRAFKNGFPHYIAVHFFDIPFMQAPALALIKQIAAVLPVTLWTFNPTGDWLGETCSKKEAITILRRWIEKHSSSEEHGNGIPHSPDASTLYDSPAERLLGALASGARGLLGQELDWNKVDASDIQDDIQDDFQSLRNLSLSIHSTYSPRRDLEAVWNGLHDFFKTHPDCKPHDALVLCGDWDTYAPVFEAVFSTDKNAAGYIPVTMAGGIPGATPLLESFSTLMDFRRNRFEFSSVFSLLSIPAIRSRFGLDDNGLAILRELAASANIRWGLDDDDVTAILEEENPPTVPRPYTWQRGLDRLALDMLTGERPDDQAMMEAGDLGAIHPTGHIEGERAACLTALWSFIAALKSLRTMTAPGTAHSAEDWKTILLDIIRTFYATDGEDINELKMLRGAILSVTEGIQAAAQASAHALDDLDSDVFIPAVLSSIRSMVPGSHTPADSVLFAPLTCSHATPHKFIWICGLNDGAFPRNVYRPSYDMLSRKPLPCDVTPREADAYALLKAVLSARTALAFSYVGCNSRTNESIPPSVLLSDLTDYFTASGLSVQTFTHPLHAHSPKYFQEQTDSRNRLPENYSSSSRAVVRRLLGQCEPLPAPAPCCSAFDLVPDGITEIAADDLAAFCSRPNHFLLTRRLGLNLPWFKADSDDDALTTAIPAHLQTELLLNEDWNEQDTARTASLLVENGLAPDMQEATEAVNNTVSNDTLNSARSYPLKFSNSKKGTPQESHTTDSCPDTTVIGAYKAFLENHTIVTTVAKDCAIDGHPVQISVSVPLIELETLNGPLLHTFVMEDGGAPYDSSKVTAWIRHLAGHAAGLNFATVLFGNQGKPARTYRPLPKEDALGMLNTHLATALSPLPAHYPDITMTAPKDDAPLSDVLDEAEGHIVSTHR